MRVELPNTGEGEVPGKSSKAEDVQDVQDIGATASKAAYVKRFGDADSMVKAILTDLHGADYEGVYWQQKAAFNRYLRGGENNLKSGDAKLLSQQVMNPTAIKMALEQGTDSVKAIKATMVESADTLGGYFVPVDFQLKVIERLQGYTVVRGKAAQMNTSRDRVEMPKLTGGGDQYTSGVRVTWVDEVPTAGTAETNLTFGLEGIPVHTVMAETPLSRNMIEDSAFNIEAYLSKKFAEASAMDEDNKFLTGDGVGKPQGILPGGANGLGLATAATTSGSALTWDGLVDATYAIASQYRQNAVWIAARGTYQAIRKLKDGAGAYLWQPFEYLGGGAGQPSQLLGYPVLEQEVMPAVAASAIPMLFVDLDGYQIVDRLGMTVERYLDSATARQNLIYYVMRRRLGGQMLETWRAAGVRVAIS
jgi:HK97 family phage major capsid protein